MNFFRNTFVNYFKYLLIQLFFITTFDFAWSKTITFVNDPFPPYVVVDQAKTQAPSGIAIDKVRSITEKIGDVKFEIEVMPWERCLKEVADGSKDAILHLLYSDERAKTYHYTLPYLKERLVIVYPRNRFPKGITWKNLSDLSGYRIIGTRGYFYNKEIEQALRDGILKLDLSSYYEDNFNRILKDRGDIFFSNESVAKEHIKRHGLENKVGIAEKPIDIINYHMAFSKKSAHLKYIEVINQIIKESENN